MGLVEMLAMMKQVLGDVLEFGYSAKEAICGLWFLQRHGVVEVKADVFGCLDEGVDF